MKTLSDFRRHARGLLWWFCLLTWLGGGGASLSGAVQPSLTQQEIAEIQAALAGMKRNPRGPYLRIRWFCNDGTVHPPAGTPCRERGGGVQHAEKSPAAVRLEELGFHVGTLLQPLNFEQFYDQANDHQLLKQLVIQNYLRDVDDGWVLRRARFYRGARQIEDEQRQGERFLQLLLGKPEWTEKHFLLTYQLGSVVPHQGSTQTGSDRVRNLATEVANLDAGFQDLRSKIHSFPDEGDIQRVRAFLKSRQNNDQVKAKLSELLSAMETQRDPKRVQELIQGFTHRLPALTGRLREMRAALRDGDSIRALSVAASIAATLRHRITSENDGTLNLVRLDLLEAIQEHCFILAEQRARRLSSESRLERIQSLSQYYRLAFAAGLLSSRELEAQLEEVAAVERRGPEVAALQLKEHLSYLSRSLDWSQAAIRQTFGPEYDRFLQVEPEVSGFLDAQARSSILLPLSLELGDLTRDIDRRLGQSHMVWGEPVSKGLAGLNPGVARGILEFAPQPLEDWLPDPNRIYVLPDTVADLRPMAGILTLDAGNLLSHAQLLARNLDIPNAAVSPSVRSQLESLAGREIFYAVSPLGRVLISNPADLGPIERSLQGQAAPPPRGKVELDVSRVHLQEASPIPLHDLRAGDAGVVVGPKAANLGELKAIFPDKVTDGVALPFGMFYRHIDRPFRGGKKLVDEIREAYAVAREMREGGRPEEEIDRFMFERLNHFRAAILELPWDRETRALLEAAIRRLPNYRDGVFVRSDTNAEDLPGFSGAGLNLTLPHRKTMDSILESVRKVWASPFSERAYLWRRQILESQENIFCSVLLLRSVPSEESGVLITRGLESGEAEDLTVVTAEGVGGAVEGQSAETLLIHPSGEWTLLSQARAPYRRVLSETGEGIEILPARRDLYLLTPDKVVQLTAAVKKWKLSRPETEADTVWDMEFGFVDGKLWLFQVRPFVAQRNSRMIERLRRLDRDLIRLGQTPISLEEPIS